MDNKTPLRLILEEVDDSLKPLTEYIASGHDEDLERQLVTKSLQPHIVEYTPNDSQKRFATVESLREWRLTKNRELHWLLGPEKDLAGIIWYGPSTFPIDINLSEVPEETFAIRLYEGYVGNGLAKPFMKQSLRLAVEQKREKNQMLCGIWLQTDVGNEAAVASYSKFGYQEVHRDEKRVTMIMVPSQILAAVDS